MALTLEQHEEWMKYSCRACGVGNLYKEWNLQYFTSMQSDNTGHILGQCHTVLYPHDKVKHTIRLLDNSIIPSWYTEEHQRTTVIHEACHAITYYYLFKEHGLTELAMNLGAQMGGHIDLWYKCMRKCGYEKPEAFAEADSAPKFKQKKLSLFLGDFKHATRQLLSKAV